MPPYKSHGFIRPTGCSLSSRSRLYPHCSRYGYGKGFYDRYFARFAKLNRYALAYENQLEPELEVLDTDIKMYRIYTEESEYKII